MGYPPNCEEAFRSLRGTYPARRAHTSAGSQTADGQPENAAQPAQNAATVANPAQGASVQHVVHVLEFRARL